MKKVGFLFLIHLIVSINNLQSQDYQCRTSDADSIEFVSTPYFGNNQFLIDLLDSVNINKATSNKNFNEDVIYRVPLKIWVHRNGTTGGITLERLKDMTEVLNDIQVDNVTGIRYYLLCDIEYINNSNYANNLHDVEANYISSEITGLHQGGAINVHVIQSWNSPTGGGVYYSVSNSIFILHDSPITTLAHEIGHFFGLEHTFKKWDSNNTCKAEPIDRTSDFASINLCFNSGLKCDKTGDGLCDTPASPQLTTLTVVGINAANSCEYIGTEKDIEDEDYISPPAGSNPPNPRNVMNYGIRECRNYYSPMQVGVMLNKALYHSSFSLTPDYSWFDGVIYPFDEYEPNNIQEWAQELFFNEGQIHTLHESYYGQSLSNSLQTVGVFSCDEDWIRFENLDDYPVSIQVKEVNGTSRPDLNIALYDNDLNLIQQANTIASGELISEIITTDQLNKNETYFIQIQNFNTNPTQTTYGSYEILIERCQDCCYNHKLLNVSEINTTTGDYNLGAQAIEWKSEIDRDLTVLNGRSLFINNNGFRDFINSPSGIATSNSYLDAYICNEANVTFNTGATLEVGSTNNNAASLNITNASAIVLQSGSEVRIISGSKLIVQQGAILDANNASIIVENNAELIIQANAIFKMNQGTLSIHNGGKIIIDYGGAMEFSGGDIFLNGPEAVFELAGRVLVSNSSNFYVKAESNAYTAGYMHIKEVPGYPEWHFEAIGVNNVITLEGSGPSNLLLLVDDGAEFRPKNDIPFRTIKIRRGTVDLGDDSRVELFAKYNVMSRINLISDGSRGVYVYDQNLFIYCDFSSAGITAPLYYHNEHLRVNNSTFHGGAGVRVIGGSFALTNCDLAFGEFNCKNITSPSLFRKCDFTQGVIVNSKLNASTIKFEKCTLIGGDDSNSNNFIRNEGGKLAFRCNTIDNYTIDVRETKLDLSANTLNGYNYFSGNDYNDGEFIKLDRLTSNLHLTNGYNTFESTAPDKQFVYMVDQNYNGTVIVKAYNNYWKKFHPTYQSYYDEGPVQERFGFESDPITYPTGGYQGSGSFELVDPYITDASSCGQHDVITGRMNGSTIDREIITDIRKNNPYNMEVNKTEFIDPIINTPLLDSISLSEALYYSTNIMEFNNDSLGDDFLATDIFYDILSYDYDTLEVAVDWMLDIAFQNMKTTVENTFNTDSISVEDNQSSFHPVIQKYVDILMLRSDDEITDENYIEQFYLEIDKAQLFNLIGKKKMSWQLLNNLDNCPVDSLEQVYLNKWIYTIGQEILSMNAGMDSYGMDSLTGVVDTTLFNAPSPLEADEFYFGAQILGVDMVTYANCGLITFKNSDKDSNPNFVVYPNPTSGILTLAYNNNDHGRLRFTLYDIKGKEILVRAIKGKQGLVQLDISFLPQASYHYSIAGDSRMISSGQIVKE